MKSKADNTPIIIDLQNISKQYVIRNWKTMFLKRPKTVTAITDVSLQVYKGEIMGLLGPNGAGKTTLLKILATLITPDSGKATISDMDCASTSLAVRKHIGYVNTNDRSFYWRLTGTENLQFFGHLHDLYGYSLNQRIKEVIQLTGLDDKQHQSFGTYSSGERQRLAIARAMLADPEILLMDEATANLDPLVSNELIQFTKNKLAGEQQKTIIWCTHNLVEAESLCDRVAILFKGKIISCTTTRSLNHQLTPQETYQLVVDRFSPLIEQQENFKECSHLLHKSCTVSLLEEEAPSLLRTLTEQGIQVYEYTKIEQSFEERFLSLLNNTTQNETTGKVHSNS